MSTPIVSRLPVRERLQWASLGLLAGALIGLVLGWLFHTVVGSIIQVIIVIALLTPFVIAFFFWRRTKEVIETPPVAEPDPALVHGDAIETTTYRVTDGAGSRES